MPAMNSSVWEETGFLEHPAPYHIIIFLFFFFLASAPNTKALCQTVAGIDCVFPFKYNDITYNGCITIKDPENKPWCSTKVNTQNKY